jgi:hypothetical protein
VDSLVATAIDRSSSLIRKLMWHGRETSATTNFMWHGREANATVSISWRSRSTRVTTDVYLGLDSKAQDSTAAVLRVARW